MKKIKISKNRKEHIRIFFRFLKENKGFTKFCRCVRNKLKTYYKDIYEYIKFNDIKLIYYVIDTMGYDDDMIELDNKWMIFLYDNKLYGTSTTCSKKDLLKYIYSIISDNFSENEETINKCFEILYKEKYCIKQLDKLIKEYEKKTI